MKTVLRYGFLMSIGLILFSCAGNTQTTEDYVSFVNPLQGTNSTREFSTGNTYPAVAMPWGLNFWVAQTGNMGDGWQYTYNDRRIKGFKQTHQPSPWINDYGCFSIMPVIGDGKLREKERASAFSHEDEIATPYYYSVLLKDYDINTEMTATHSSSFFRFIFPKAEDARVVIDGWEKGSRIKVIPEERKITGYSTWHTTNNDNKLPENFATYFVLIFDKDFDSSAVFDDYKVKGGKSEIESDHVGAFVSFKTKKGEKVTTQISSSFISLSQAELNLSREIGNKTFVQIKDESKAAWNKELGRVKAESGDKEQLTTFYTALYRMMLFPRKFHEYDKNGEMFHYSAMNGKIEKGSMYTDNGFWDTFRAVHPFFTIMYPDMSTEIMEALLNYYKEGGWMPEWSSPGYRNSMIGQNSTSLVANAYIKGIKAADENMTWEAIIKGANHEGPLPAVGREGADYYNKLGYVPYDKIERGSVSKTLEYAYNDFCIAQLAKAMGKSQDTVDHYFNKALNYKNVFDQSIGFMRPKDSKGKWKTEHWKPDMWGGAFTEGSAWHWTWSVFHDPQGLIDLFGGRKEFVQKLDSVFTAEPTYSWYQPGVNRVIHEMAEMVAGNMGQYAHGNQPIQHAIYLYNFAGEPHKAQKWSRYVMDHLYSSGLQDGKGLCGDEDNGQTSAWYVFSAMGFYPLCPGTGQYIIGSPLFEKITLDLPNGKQFSVIAHHNSDKNIYIQSARLNNEKNQ